MLTNSVDPDQIASLTWVLTVLTIVLNTKDHFKILKHNSYA